MKVNYWTEQEIEIFSENYGKISEIEMMGLLPGRSKVAFRMKAEHLGIRNKQRTNFCNEDFFETPNLLNSYWAGFIAADGYLFANNTRLGIILALEDKGHILEFAKDIEFIGNYVERSRAFSTRPEKLFAQFGIQVNSRKICSDLISNFNIHANKSLTLLPPQNLSLENELAFIIGYIDGDGSVNMVNKPPFVSMSGTKEMLTWIKKHFDTVLITSNTIRHVGNIYTYHLGYGKAKNTFNYLKDINVPKLDRKWNKQERLI